MAPKKADTLLGKRVVAPRSLWPDYPLPRGQTGWEGEAAAAVAAAECTLQCCDCGLCLAP